MSGTPNIHHEQLWRLQALFARDGVIDASEADALNAQLDICDCMDAAHGLAFRGAVPRAIQRSRPDLLTATGERAS